MKELEEQIKFQNSIKNVHKRIDEEYARSVMEDVEKFYEEEKLKREFQLKKIQTCKKELEKQLDFEIFSTIFTRLLSLKKIFLFKFISELKKTGKKTVLLRKL